MILWISERDSSPGGHLHFFGRLRRNFRRIVGKNFRAQRPSSHFQPPSFTAAPPPYPSSLTASTLKPSLLTKKIVPKLFSKKKIPSKKKLTKILKLGIWSWRVSGDSNSIPPCGFKSLRVDGAHPLNFPHSILKTRLLLA